MSDIYIDRSLRVVTFCDMCMNEMLVDHAVLQGVAAGDVSIPMLEALLLVAQRESYCEDCESRLQQGEEVNERGESEQA